MSLKLIHQGWEALKSIFRDQCIKPSPQSFKDSDSASNTITKHHGVLAILGWIMMGNGGGSEKKLLPTAQPGEWR